MKLAIVGGGSTYTPELIDGFARLREVLPLEEIHLVDPDEHRLALVAGMSQRMLAHAGHPGRVVGTDLVNPDFAAWAHAFGAYGEVVLRSEDFAAAFERALAQDRPALLELRADSEAITPRQTLSQIRAEASETLH